MKFNECVNEYKNYNDYMEIANSSTETYLSNCKRFFEVVDKDVEDVKKSDVNRYLMNFKETHSYSSLELMVRSLSSFYKVMIDELELFDIVNPTNGIKLPKRKEEQEHHMALTKQQVEQLLRHCKNCREVAMIKLFVKSGIRFHELSNITLEQYLNRGEDNSIELVVTKGSHNRMIYLGDDVIEAIDKYINTLRKNDCGCDRLFVSNQGTPMDRCATSRTLKCIARRADFDEEFISKLSNHCLRSTFSSININNGVPVPIVAKALGHKSGISVVLNHYYKENQDDIKNIMCNTI